MDGASSPESDFEAQLCDRLALLTFELNVALAAAAMAGIAVSVDLVDRNDCAQVMVTTPEDRA